MKKILVILLLCASGALNADESEKIAALELPDGRVYKNVTVTGSSPAWLKIMHHSGVSKLMLSECGVDMQERYGYDAKKAEAYLISEAKESKLESEKEAERRLEVALKMEELAKEKEAKEKEYLKYKRTQKREKEEAEFLRKVASKAVKIEVIAHRNTDVGLVGKVTVFKKTMVDKAGSSFKKAVRWKADKTLVAAITGTTNAIVTEENGLNTVTWSGKAWEIGKVSYKDEQGLDMTSTYFTASKLEAEEYYRAKLKQK